MNRAIFKTESDPAKPAANYNPRQSDYEEQLRLLNEKLKNSGERRKATYERSSAEEREDAAAALRKKYIENRFAVKRLPQVSATRGLSGGAVRSAFRKTLADYGEGRENLIKERDRAVAKLLESYEQGSQKDYETYASRLDALRRKYAGL